MCLFLNVCVYACVHVYLHPLLEEFLALKFMHAAVTMQHVKRLENREKKNSQKSVLQYLYYIKSPQNVLSKISTLISTKII
jgi:hypothetical protein